ncbi:MAG: glycine cleavage system protein H [Deltaproteobacteria bacterium]|nr:glycine cleavage system protein H [Deltaproteobacteria bacterium]MBW2138460.1 glycine cleavage system protein H [Deltaproteobacteria bacterium]
MGAVIRRDRAKQGHRKCLWMQAGVVKKKYCRHEYDCPSCRFDIVMHRTASENRKRKEAGGHPRGRAGSIISWKEKLLSLPRYRRPCVHHLKGRIEFMPCHHEYRCGVCEFDQYFFDKFSVNAVVRPIQTSEVKGFKVPQGYYFHRGHTWLQIEEGPMVRVGIDDFALRLMGPLDRIESPLIGKEVRQGRGDILVSRGENRAQLNSPVSGIVTSINPRPREQGSIANRDPYNEGWVMKVHSSNLRRDVKSLTINEETRAFMDKEVTKLYGFLEDEGKLAADGGFLGEDIYGSLRDVPWEKLVGQFLNPLSPKADKNGG